MTEHNNPGPLAGIRVLELGQLLAGPFTASILGYFGAEIIKVEPPEGDQIRRWRIVKDDTALWWYSLGRNKKSIVIDLKSEEGRALVKELANECDVLIENFRPGVMENWGLGPEDLKATNPELIYTRISGYGQTGPYSTKPGFASVCEGISGFRFLNGFPDEAPVRPNLSIGDSIASLHAVIGILMSLTAKLRNRASGQVVDVALYESMFNLLEGVIPEYSGAGVIRQPSGTTVTGIVPTNTYRCEDGKFVVIGGNGDSIFKRLMIAIGREDMANDPELADNAGRVTHERTIDKVLASWCSSLPSKTVIATLEEARVPVGPIYNAEDMFKDPHFQARGLFEEVPVGDDTIHIPAITPKLSETPGATRWPGPKLGEHSDRVLKEVLGKSDSAIESLRQTGAVR
ncbi:CaiB/BaiF CoA transferase family protein [Litorivivens sp.]|uniref:CaiB/BaiF CoA transferase family protein n=1 Tax=Litorivivens sp. TaxID=2020868 RepID=UPI0035669B64